MRIIVFTGLIILASLCTAQNWAPIYSSSDNYYKTTSNNPSVSDEFFGTKIDSFNLIGTDSILFPFLKMGNNGNPYSCAPLYDTSWLASKIVKKNDSSIFYTKSGLPIVFKRIQNVGQNWQLFEEANGNYFQTLVYQLDTLSLNGIVDSIAVLRLSYYDSTNSILPFPLTADSLIISKSNGLLSKYEWSHFPNPSEQLSSFTIHRPMLRSEAFDFNVNDEFHYDKSYNVAPPSTINVKILAKWFSTNSDTVYYEREVRERHSYVDFTMSPPQLVYTYNSDTNVAFYTNLPKVINDGVPTEPILSGNNLQNYSSIKTFEILNNTYNNRRIELAYEGLGYFDNDSNCYVASKSHYRNNYVEGCGVVESFSDNSSTGQSYTYRTQLIYFKKGTETWGQPRVVTGIENNHLTMDDFTIYPNPVSQILNIKIGQESFQEIQIFDLNGRVVSTQKFQNQINVETLKSGVYILKVIGNENVTEQKFIKQ